MNLAAGRTCAPYNLVNRPCHIGRISEDYVRRLDYLKFSATRKAPGGPKWVSREPCAPHHHFYPPIFLRHQTHGITTIFVPSLSEITVSFGIIDPIRVGGRHGPFQRQRYFSEGNRSSPLFCHGKRRKQVMSMMPLLLHRWQLRPAPRLLDFYCWFFFTFFLFFFLFFFLANPPLNLSGNV